jgi:hypothetical protein
MTVRTDPVITDVFEGLLGLHPGAKLVDPLDGVEDKELGESSGA